MKYASFIYVHKHKAKSFIPTKCLFHLHIHFHIIPHQNICRHFQYYH